MKKENVKFNIVLSKDEIFTKSDMLLVKGGLSAGVKEKNVKCPVNKVAQCGCTINAVPQCACKKVNINM